MCRRGVSTLVVLAAAAGALATPAAATRGPERVLLSASSARGLPPSTRLVAELAPGLRAYTVDVPRHQTAERYAGTLRRRAAVFAAQPDRIPMRPAAIFGLCASAPADVLSNVPGSVGAFAIEPTTTKPIAVLDTGVAADTPELSGRVLGAFDATRNVAGGGDADGHGTQVAAVAAGSPGRFRGVSPASPVLPIQVYTSDGNTSAAWLVRAIKAAVQQKAGVINISGSNVRKDIEQQDGGAQDIAVFEQAIAAAYAQGVITVAAAGNEGKGDATIPGSLAHVLTVGSAGLDGTRDSFSNFGPYLDLVAPGNGLVVPAPHNVCDTGFGGATGTSFSAPMVAGAVALLQARRPSLTTQQLFDLVRSDAVTAIGAVGRNDDTGFGALNVEAGLAAAAPAKEARELDDDVFWLKGVYAKKHPPLLKRTRGSKLAGRVSSAKDPQDVVPVYLKKGEGVSAEVVAKPSGAVVDLGIWNRTTGAFDIGLGRTTKLLADPAGLTGNPLVRYRAKRTGTYFVSVEAPDIPNPADTQATPDFKVEPEIGYSLTLRKLRAKKSRKRKSR